MPVSMVNFWQALRIPPRRLVLWHSVAAVPMGAVVVLGAYLSYHYHALAKENREHVDHAYEVLDVVDGLFISVQSADVSRRDYVITGDPARLGPFQAAVRAEVEDSARLHALFERSPGQAARMARLDAAVSAKLREFEQTIATRDREGFDAARGVIERGDRGRAMDDIRQQVLALSQAERGQLVRRQAAAQEHERETLLGGIFIAALSVLTRLSIALGLKWYHRRQRRANAEAASGGTPEARGQPG
ncbi:MAG: CHASE3 domain-containing protein [Burkholderiaceae bacterium]